MSEITRFFKECYADYSWHLLGTNFWYENNVLSYKSNIIKENETYIKIICIYE